MRTGSRTPGVVWSVKGGQAARDASDTQIDVWLSMAEQMRINTGDDVAVLVVARKGIGPANARRWWAIVPYIVAYDLRSGGDRLVQPECWDLVEGAPVRLHLTDMCHLLTAAGYGTRTEEVA